MSQNQKSFLPKPFVAERPQHRPAKFAQRIREELVELIPGSLKDPRLAGVMFITITEVELSKDFRHGTVKFGLMGQDERAGEIEACLNDASNFLRRELKARIKSKSTPHLVFRFDKTLGYSTEISEILRKI